MRILLLTHAFNSLTQRLHVELARAGHQLSVEFDINDRVTEEAVELFRPDVVIASYLRRAIPETVWQNHLCLVVHPGPVGDRGPSALDWAILNGETEWGVTLLQANAVMDGGPVWASRTFPMRPAAKGSLYRNEVTEAAVACVTEALAHLAPDDGFAPAPQQGGEWRRLMKQADRAIDWQADNTATVLRKIRSADGFPGVLDEFDGRAVYLFDAHPETTLTGEPGALIARHDEAVCRATVDGAVWIGHLKAKAMEDDERTLKLPATVLLGEAAAILPEATPDSWAEIRYEEKDGVGYLQFPFYNGAMSTAQCVRLREAFERACAAGPQVIVLTGGPDFWSNGLNLNTIEAAESAADESWDNINAMDDLCRAVMTAGDRYVIAAMQGNAGAGGVFLALAADRVLARDGVVMNPHYKNMGNLYGSEYWTWLLPRRVGEEGVARVMGRRLPLGAPEAQTLGLIDDCFLDLEEVEKDAAKLAADTGSLQKKLERKQARLAEVDLETYRRDELDRMRLNFYGFDPSYHVARYNFVYKVPHSRTPLHLAAHRRRT